VSGPLNANELKLLTQWAELQECVQECSSKISETVLPFMFKDGEAKKK